MGQHKILIAWHSRTGASEAIANAVANGAESAAKLRPAAEVSPQDVLDAAAYVFVCPENLAAMSGVMKDMFDRCYYPVLGKIEGRGYATIIAAGSDGENAQRQIDRIATGWRLKRVAEPMIIGFNAQTADEILAPKTVPPSKLERCEEIGASMFHGLDMGLF